MELGGVQLMEHRWGLTGVVCFFLIVNELWSSEKADTCKR